MSMYLKQLSFDHACRLRPKGYCVRVWEYCVSQAVLDKAWANDTIRNKPNWAKQASEMSISMLGEYLHKSVTQLAKESYDYFKIRAYGHCYTGALDPAARKRWESITGKRIPPTQYWLYDHRNPNAAREYRFNAKRGYGWIKLTKREQRKLNKGV